VVRRIERAGDLAGILTNLGERDLMFIDEIHRLHASIEEYLYPAIEDFRLDIIIDQGPKARNYPHRPAALHARRCDDPRGYVDRAHA